ncbi:hypothetical protein Dimus_010431 [Dionaea muscipula]
MEKEVEGTDTGSGEKYYDAVDEERPDDVDVQVSDVVAPTPSSVQQKEKTASGVDPSGSTGSISDSDFLKLQVEYDRLHAERLQAELDKARAKNSRLQALLQQATPQPKP